MKIFISSQPTNFQGPFPKRAMSPTPNFPLCGKGGYADITNDTEIPGSFFTRKPSDNKAYIALAEIHEFIAGEDLRIWGKKGSCNRQIDTASNWVWREVI